MSITILLYGDNRAPAEHDTAAAVLLYTWYTIRVVGSGGTAVPVSSCCQISALAAAVLLLRQGERFTSKSLYDVATTAVTTA